MVYRQTQINKKEKKSIHKTNEKRNNYPTLFQVLKKQDKEKKHKEGWYIYKQK